MRRFLQLGVIVALFISLSFASLTRASSQEPNHSNDKPQKTDAKVDTTPTKPAHDPTTGDVTDEGIEAIKVGAEVVLVNVVVTDPKNRYVENLNKEEFELLEDGKKQELTFFKRQDEPVSIGILVDSSTSMLDNGKLVEARAAVRSILSNSNSQDEAFLMRFDDKSVMLQEFTSDFKLLSQQVDRLKPNGGTAIYDALIRGMLELNKNAKRVRQALVMITDGLDQHSRKTFKEVLPIAQKTGIPCYMIGIYTAEEQRAFAQAQATNQNRIKLDNGTYVDNPALTLRSIAEETAGRIFLPTSEKELVPIALQIVNELRAGYALGYYPPEGSLDGRYHTISVLSKSKKYVIRARRGYLAKTPGE